MMQNRIVMVHNGIEVDVSRALPAMDKAATKSRITEEYLQAASSDLVASKPKLANWYCLQVMSGKESSVENRLAVAKIETVSPRERVVFVKNGRKFEGDRLFFPGYIIVRCRPSPEAFQGLRGIKGVIDIVGNMGKYHILRDAEVSRFKDMAQIKSPRVKTDKTFAEGDRATITFGPFKHFDALLIAVKYGREARARVMISVFGRQFEIDMPIAFLKKL